MKLSKLAKRLNKKVFNGEINLSAVEFRETKKFIGAEGIAGITYAFEDKYKNRSSLVYLFSKYCKGKTLTNNVLLHELVHVYQNQLKCPINHNGAFMRYYIKKARTLGYEIDMKEF